MFFDASRPHPCERLARLEGQSNFLSLLSGIEAGPDTTQDAAALGMTRRRGRIPEILEAYWGRSSLHRIALCQFVFDAIAERGEIKPRDRIWTKGAILDAFDRYATDACPVARDRAKQFKVDSNAYEATRKLAEGMFTSMEGDSRPVWMRIRSGS
jgi:hypothetical protein